MPDRTAAFSFLTARRVVFGIALASYVLSFFHRTAPAAIAGELTRAFAIGGAVLGTLAATYFYVYTILQVPIGVLADTLGPRRILAVGSLVAGIGSLLFGLAPAWEVAAVGRTLVGVGVSVAFIAILKICAVWFPADRFATVVGITMFAGTWGRSSPARRSRGWSRKRRGARGSSRSACCRCCSRSVRGGASAIGPSRWDSPTCAASRPRRRSAGRMRCAPWLPIRRHGRASW